MSAGLVAVGAAGLQSALADDSTLAAPSKAWTVSATLRGFYDDNYTTTTDSSKKGSFGIELSPSISTSASLQQTDIGFRYTYGLYWYQERQILRQDAIDQSHQMDFWLDHAFDERWKATITDTFAVGQEPELLSGGTPYRVEGDNVANHFNIALNTQWTRQFSTSLHYENDFYDYQATGFNNPSGASYAGLLNRFDQNAGLDLQWHLQMETMAFIGYSLDWIDYNANEEIVAGPPITYYSRDRDSLTHQVHVGLQHQFTANLGGTVSVGGQYTDSYNIPVGSSGSWSPYANVSLNYTYLPGSYAQLGFTHTINATDVAQVSGSSLSLYQQSSTLYGNINHRFTEKLTGSVLAQVVYSDYEGGGITDPDVDYSLGLNLAYQINRNLSADIGYNYDDLQSDVAGRGYERNRYYIGMTASY